MFERLSRYGNSPVLESSNIILRAPRSSDWAKWVETRAASRKFLTPWEPKWSQDALSRSTFKYRIKRYAEEARDETGFSFFLFHRETDELVGGVTVSNIRRGVAQIATLGYWSAEKHSRQGYMYEAILVLLPWLFNEQGLHRVEAACLPANIASFKLLEKLGFTREGLARQYLCINGVWHDHLLYGLLKSDQA